MEKTKTAYFIALAAHKSPKCFIFGLIQCFKIPHVSKFSMLSAGGTVPPTFSTGGDVSHLSPPGVTPVSCYNTIAILATRT